jgi:hypothetical protein
MAAMVGMAILSSAKKCLSEANGGRSPGRHSSLVT